MKETDTKINSFTEQLPFLSTEILHGRKPKPGTIIRHIGGKAEYRFVDVWYKQYRGDLTFIRFVLGITEEGKILTDVSTAGEWFVTDRFEEIPNAPTQSLGSRMSQLFNG